MTKRPVEEKLEGTTQFYDCQKAYGKITLTDGREARMNGQPLKNGGFAYELATKKATPIVVDVQPNKAGTLVVVKIHSLAEQAASCKKSHRRRQFKTFLEPGKKATGHVAPGRWNKSRGFGHVRVTSVDDHKDVFLHITAIPDEITDAVVAGNSFEFIVGRDEQGRLRAHPQQLT